MIDAPGPWGTGPFTLTEGYSAIYDYSLAFINQTPFAATWLQPREERTDRVVLTANPTHWNIERGPRLEKVVYVNDLSEAGALDAVCDREGEIDIVGEVSPSDARRVTDSAHANLVAIDAMRVLIAIVNRGPEAAPMSDVRVRRALNLAVDRDRFLSEVLQGYGTPLAGLTPPWAKGCPEELLPYPYDPDQARTLLDEAGWPAGRALRLAAPPPLAEMASWLADQYRAALGIEVELVLPSADELPMAERRLVEKKLPLPWDILLHAWFDLTSDVPPAVMHREFFHTVGAFRAGPPVPAFDELFGRYMVQVDDNELERIGADLDRLVYDDALAVFLASPQALYAVNEHVSFVAHRATFELAETEVDEQHWSRRETDTPPATTGPTGEREHMASMETVNLEDARRVIAAGEAKAAEIGQPMNIAVVDVGGNLVAHVRMDGAWIGSVDIAINKAFTSRAFDIPTKDLGENAQPTGQFFGIHASNQGRIMIFAGGMPLYRGDSVIGAVGVSGGTGDQDQSVVEAAARAL